MGVDWSQDEDHRLHAEDAAEGVGLLLTIVLAMTLVCLFVVEAWTLAPPALQLLAFVSLIVGALVASAALIARLFSIPTRYREGPPVLHVRRRTSRNPGMPPSRGSAR